MFRDGQSCSFMLILLYLRIQFVVATFFCKNTSPFESESQRGNNVFLRPTALFLAHQPHCVCLYIPSSAVNFLKLGTDFHLTSFPHFRILFIKNNI